MKLVDRYILQECLLTFTYCVLALCMLYVVTDLFSTFPDLIEARIPFWEALQFYGNYLLAVNGFVPFLVMVLPISLLLSTLYTLLSFGRHSELIAMRAGGVSMQRMAAPLLGLGLVCTLLSAAAEEWAGPPSTRWISRFRQERLRKSGSAMAVVRNFPYYSGVSRRHWLIGKFDPREPGRLKHVIVTLDRPNGGPAEAVTADVAEWLDGEWWFSGIRVQKYGPNGDPDGPSTAPPGRPAEMPDLTETPKDFLNDLAESQDMMGFRDALSSSDMIHYLGSHRTLSSPDRAKWLVDLHTRLTMPWSCITMVLFALPAGASTRRKGALPSIALAIGFLFVFYASTILGRIFGSQDLMPAWLAIWLPNLGFLAAGAALTLRLE